MLMFSPIILLRNPHKMFLYDLDNEEISYIQCIYSTDNNIIYKTTLLQLHTTSCGVVCNYSNVVLKIPFMLTEL